MSSKTRNRKTGRNDGPFVKLEGWMLKSEAWATMKPGPRALYVELKRRFNGNNNGKIFLSCRDAAKALNVTTDTANQYFKQLEARGFITVIEGGHLGPSGVGRATKWALQEVGLNQRPPAKGFMSWRQNQNPVQKTRTPCPEN